MKKTILITVICLIFVPNFSHAEKIYFDKNGQYTKKYQDKKFDMCGCIKEGYKFYPNKRSDMIQKMCKDSFIEYLMKKSEALNEIVTGNYYSCTE